MKKFLVTILAFAYMTSTIGAVLRLDCCLEKLVAFTLPSTTTNQLHDANKYDCKDDHQQAKLGHEQKRHDAKIRVAKFVPASLPTDFSTYTVHTVATLTEAYPVNNAPPHTAKIPLFILHCVHLI